MSRRPAGDAETTVMREIVARIDALDDLIQDLMMYARPRPPRLSPVHLRHLIDEAVTMLHRDPVGSGVHVRIEGDGGDAIVDPDLIRATVLNLLLNAAQAMSGKGEVHLSTGTRDGKWTIEVRDNGPGIPLDIREQVLEPFFTTKARGGGLGLPIAKRVAELHGGTLTLVFPPDGGTTVSVEAPTKPPVQTT
jgi:signal transduction histidine kinase